MDKMVSIIMPVYNAELYIEQAIRSVLQQTYSNWELIIVNDGSKDRTPLILTSFDDESRIRIFHQNNEGVSSARNIGLQNMKGQFFCFLDADDQLTPSSLALRVKLLEQNESISFVDGTISIMNNSMTKQLKIKKHTFVGNPFGALIRLDETCFFGPTWMIRRKKKQIYRFEKGLSHGEDLFFFISICQKSDQYIAIKDHIYNYRTGNNSAMNDLNGLASGYFQIYELFKEMNLPIKELIYFKNKICSILLKSSLRYIKPSVLGRVVSFYLKTS